MMLRDYHIHTTFCDGENTPEEIVREAVERGFSTIGFSGHSYTWFDETWCMSREATARYISEIRDLSEKYRGKIEVLCGIEQDYYSEESTKPYDYVIGSVHYLKYGEEYLMVDETEEWQKLYCEKYFGGDFLPFAELYFETAGNIVERTGCDIIGHFDVVSKFNRNGILFDESCQRYRSAWKKAADRLLETGKPFEINTGAMASGFREVPYPSPEIFEYLRDRGAKFVPASDCHKSANLGYGFSEVKDTYGVDL